MAVPSQAFAIDEHRIAYAGFARDGRHGFTLREFRTAELPADTFLPGFLGGPVHEPRAFDERVTAFVADLPGSVREATLVVPDAWVRTAFVEAGDLPRTGESRNDVLRWKLKRLLPFRVDDLRLSSTEVAAMPSQLATDEPRRLLLGFGLEHLMAQLEDAFAAAGVRIGRIINEGLAAPGALREDLVAPGELLAFAQVADDSYTLLFVADGAPVLHRFKAFSEGLPDEARGSFVGRDLLLTKSFLDENLPDAHLARVVLSAPTEWSHAWSHWLEDTLGRPAEQLGPEHLLPLRSALSRPVPGWSELLPLAGAVAQEVH
jgi:hypothetical protein